MKGLLSGSEASLATAMPPPGAGVLLGRRALKVGGSLGPVSQGTCQCGGGTGRPGWELPQEAAPDGSCLLPLPPPPAHF